MIPQDQYRITTEHMGFPKISEQLLKRVSSAKFNSLWQQILDTLHDKLVPYIWLVEVLCGGELRLACHGCMEEVTVLDVFMHSQLIVTEDRYVGPHLMFGSVSAVYCGRQRCLESEENIFKQELDLMEF